MKKGLLLVLIIFLGCSQLLLAQTKKISGTVTSAEDGAPVPGVSVSVKGTTLGIITNSDGNYTLTVPESAKTLVFTFVGMMTQEVPISGTVINVRLKPDVIGVEEVVVTGIGVATDKRKVAMSIESVNEQSLNKIQNRRRIS